MDISVLYLSHAVLVLAELIAQGVHSPRLYAGISIRENEKKPKVSNYFAYYPKVSSFLMERTQKYHRIVKR